VRLDNRRRPPLGDQNFGVALRQQYFLTGVDLGQIDPVEGIGVLAGQSHLNGQG
jgi:hypothetical protein